MMEQERRESQQETGDNRKQERKSDGRRRCRVEGLKFGGHDGVCEHL
jgi:hypothetical protein